MKKLAFALAALATVTTSQAFAATRHATMPSAAYNAYASVQDGYSVADPNVVVFDGRIIGRDPDPNVRLEIRRDLAGYAS